MAFELDPCRVRALSGELLAQGFVREHEDDAVAVDVEHEAGGWLAEGDHVVVEILSAHRGTLTYDAAVQAVVGRRVVLEGLALRNAVQLRQAVRVPTSIPVVLAVAAPADEPTEAAEPATVDAVVLDVSAHGMRVRCHTEVVEGARLAMRFGATRTPLDLVLEVVRVHELAGDAVLGCRLVDASERTTDELFRFVLEEQRRQLAVRAAGAR
ncbi:PilZ domain-containing protein [Actinotalea ferrariae]|uniref:PilZ domain-containing protein n=1 Tax=Actinotalea ferrariae TaxID=1386098 RepID=UPI001C8BC1A5|nr:PilZ domain-containing protein [Actinotalea ferrariae]MBX9246093.1 PilZ domain-containing protein [Actinotalea ferrariae]